MGEVDYSLTSLVNIIHIFNSFIHYIMRAVLGEDQANSGEEIAKRNNKNV